VTDPHWQRRQAYPTEGWDGDSATAGYGVTLLAGSESAHSGPHDDGGPPRDGPNELSAREPKEAFRQRQKSYEHVTERRSRIKTGMRSVPKVAASQLHHDMARDGVVLECVHGQILAVTRML
jgi:hypothetical protein